MTDSNGTEPLAMTAPERPIFIVGDARSGTTLLYLLLTSCREFPVYRAETHMLDVCPVRFGVLKTTQDFQSFFDAWVASKQFERSGLSVEQLRAAWGTQPKPYVALLGEFMQAIAKDQGKARWVEKTPAHVGKMTQIKQQFPDAQFIHAIRDPRDVAISRKRLGWVADVGASLNVLLATCLDWERLVLKARADSAKFPADYVEVKYESLATDPASTMQQICEFVGATYEPDILSAMKTSNSAFDSPNDAVADSSVPAKSSPVGRWKSALSDQELSAIDVAVGQTLQLLGYPRSEIELPASTRLKLLIKGLKYRGHIRQTLKEHTPLRKLSKADLD